MLEKFVRDYGWIHLSIGLLGNLLFVVGSACFLLDTKEIGTLAFFAGSVGMLLGKIGETFASVANHRWKIDGKHEHVH